jgi:hypothetical protein
VTLSTQLVPHLVNRLAWGEAHLVEGTEALLWPAATEDAAAAELLPEATDAVRAVLSWVRPKVLRFEMTGAPQAAPELMLVSTRAVSGPAQFVVRKSYQISTTVVCEPPDEIRILERRDLFRVPVATRVTVTSPEGRWTLHSMDCSLGGMRICPPALLEVGTEVRVDVDLGRAPVVNIPAVVRHSRPFADPDAAFTGCSGADCDGCPSLVGLQFLEVPGDVERYLAQFVARHQRRLMPRVKALLAVDYRCAQRRRFVEGVVNELSPGDVTLVTHEAHLPGDGFELRMSLAGREYNLTARAVSCQSSPSSGGRTRHLVRASLDDFGEAAEARFRTAVRDLAVEQLGADEP